MEGFNNHQGASNRDMEGGKGEAAATEAAVVEGVGDAYKMRIRKHQEAFPNTSPRWEDPSKIICRVSTMVVLSRLSQGDRHPAEVATKTKTQHTQTNTKYSTTGTCAIHMDLTSKATIQLRAGSGEKITRKVSLAKMHKHTLMQDMLQALGECIETFYQQTFDCVGQR